MTGSLARRFPRPSISWCRNGCGRKSREEVFATSETEASATAHAVPFQWPGRRRALMFFQSLRNFGSPRYEINYGKLKPLAENIFQRGKSRAALSYKILRFAAATIGSALNFSMF